MSKVIDSVLLIDTFEKQYVMLKGMLQLPRLKYHLQTIGIYQSLSNSYIYEHKYLENKKLYKQAGKCDNQQQFKDIIDSDMVSTPEGFTNSSHISPMISKPIKKPSARKSLCLFTNIFEVKKNLLTVDLELLNLSARQLNLEINHGH